MRVLVDELAIKKVGTLVKEECGIRRERPGEEKAWMMM